MEEKNLRLNVGFVLKEAVGYRRKLEIGFDDPFQVQDIFLYQLQGTLELTRTSEGVWVDGVIDVWLPITCARCLAEFDHRMQIQIQELFYFPALNAPSDEDYGIQENGILDLNEPIREQLVLGVPIQLLCRPDCKGLCNKCGQDLNQGECDCQDDVIDPRMAQLQALKERLSKAED
jgi:uncharacterized protein